MAEDEMVEIVPNMRMDPLNMLCVCSSLCSCYLWQIELVYCRWVTCIMDLQGDFGPFYPQMAAQVPLWLAIAMKKRGKCTIRPPEWMSIGESCFGVSLINGSLFVTCLSKNVKEMC